MVVFVLWDDHIYDAWVKKAQELKLTPYDPSDAPEVKTSKHDQEQSSKKFSPNVTDLSTSDQHKKTDDHPRRSIIRPASDPNDSPDTQDAESMELESESTKDKPPLSTGNT